MSRKASGVMESRCEAVPSVTKMKDSFAPAAIFLHAMPPHPSVSSSGCGANTSALRVALVDVSSRATVRNADLTVCRTDSRLIARDPIARRAALCPLVDRLFSECEYTITLPDLGRKASGQAVVRDGTLPVHALQLK
jgi:hypothetical protein